MRKSRRSAIHLGRVTRFGLGLVFFATVLSEQMAFAMTDWAEFFAAVKAGDTKTVEELLNKGQDIEQTDDTRRDSPLIIAVQENNERMIRFLIQRGANINSTATMQTPLQNATKPQTARVLVELGANVNQVHDGSTAFIMSGSIFCDEDMVRAYAELGADFTLLNSYILAACLRSQDDIRHRRQTVAFMKFLVSKGAKPSASTDALYLAASQGDDQIVQYLLSQGAQVNSLDSQGWLPLNGANKPTTIKLLLKAGANPLAKDRGGDDAMISAARECNAEKFSILVESGGDINTTNIEGLKLDDDVAIRIYRLGGLPSAQDKRLKRNCEKILKIIQKSATRR